MAFEELIVAFAFAATPPEAAALPKAVKSTKPNLVPIAFREAYTFLLTSFYAGSR